MCNVIHETGYINLAQITLSPPKMLKRQYQLISHLMQVCLINNITYIHQTKDVNEKEQIKVNILLGRPIWKKEITIIKENN